MKQIIRNMSAMNMTVDDIVHYGVPGMKWGVRKAKPSSGKRRAASRSERKAGKKAVKADRKMRQRVGGIDMQVYSGSILKSKRMNSLAQKAKTDKRAKEKFYKEYADIANKHLAVGLNSGKIKLPEGVKSIKYDSKKRYDSEMVLDPVITLSNNKKTGLNNYTRPAPVKKAPKRSKTEAIKVGPDTFKIHGMNAEQATKYTVDKYYNLPAEKRKQIGPLIINGKKY